MRKQALTKQGTPRKIKSGGGRPQAGRTERLSIRVKPEAKQSFQAHATANDLSLAEAVEEGARRLRPGGEEGPAEEPCIIIISGSRRKR